MSGMAFQKSDETREESSRMCHNLLRSGRKESRAVQNRFGRIVVVTRSLKVSRTKAQRTKRGSFYGENWGGDEKSGVGRGRVKAEEGEVRIRTPATKKQRFGSRSSLEHSAEVVGDESGEMKLGRRRKGEGRNGIHPSMLRQRTGLGGGFEMNGMAAQRSNGTWEANPGR
jgi:hypothetical protein